MIFEQLNDGNCRTYLIASEETREAVLVDPLLGREDHDLRVLADRGLKLLAVLDTHTHADHLSACALLRDRTGADHGVHAASRISGGNLRVEEGQSLQLGDIPVEFLHTPGHTPDSLSLRLPDRLLTGDFLFLGEGGAGRTDLPGGDPGAHWDSLQKLSGLDGSLLVFPGHDYRGRTSSTLADERKANPRLQPRSRADYVAWLEGLDMPPAEWMKAVVQANLACVRTAEGIEIPAGGAVCEVGAGCSTVPQMSCEALLGSQEPVLLLDVREAMEFTGPTGHLPGSRLLPLGQLPARMAAELPDRDQPIVAICAMGGRSNAAVDHLLKAGYTRVASLAGGMARWHALGYPVER